MKEIKNIQIAYTAFDSVEELDAQEQELLILAEKAADTAYAPYSQFNVGAALLLENGVVLTGNNQENVAYPSGTCAERVVAFYAGAQHPNVKFKTIAITAKSTVVNIISPVAPCGACRQALSEYESRFNSDIKIILKGGSKVFVVNNVKSLLPLMFVADELKKS